MKNLMLVLFLLVAVVSVYINTVNCDANKAEMLAECMDLVSKCRDFNKKGRTNGYDSIGRLCMEIEYSCMQFRDRNEKI